MRVKVDLNLCEANAICCGLAPKVFELDDEDILHVKVDEVPEELEKRVQMAVDRCPKAALSKY
ncbi:ferredoxin [Tomitella fengzijianii]|uniref:Ferredoxin n=1 Tax=Tomitella fengzijianii TaxID=2597660 RepID=A0A516X184_9ACTN|nr:ferredoxin [Tomitella fengzijianii]QDQ96828.1 ferredoxin [Tomitella fengzijianii]